MYVYVHLFTQTEELIARLRPDFPRSVVDGGWHQPQLYYGRVRRAPILDASDWGWNGFIGSFKNLVDWLADISSGLTFCRKITHRQLPPPLPHLIRKQVEQSLNSLQDFSFKGF